MKRACIVMAFFCLLAFPGVMAFSDIAENFKAGGASFSGGGSLYYDANTVFDTSNQWNYFSFSANLDVEFLTVDKLSIGLIPRVSTTQTHTNDFNISGTLSFGLAVGVTYYFVSGNNALVPSIGIVLGTDVYPGVGYTSAGVSYPGKSLAINPFLNFPLALNWFLTQRTALYLAATPEIYFWTPLKDALGNAVTDNRTFLNRLGVDVTVGFGIRYFVPTRDKAIVK
jgi:hypothetical protein